MGRLMKAAIDRMRIRDTQDREIVDALFKDLGSAIFDMSRFGVDVSIDIARTDSTHGTILVQTLEKDKVLFSVSRVRDNEFLLLKWEAGSTTMTKYDPKSVEDWMGCVLADAGMRPLTTVRQITGHWYAIEKWKRDYNLYTDNRAGGHYP
jgi:hypothetical protein